MRARGHTIHGEGHSEGTEQVSTGRAGGASRVLVGAGTRLGASWARGSSRGPAWGDFPEAQPAATAPAWGPATLSLPGVARGSSQLAPVAGGVPAAPQRGRSMRGPSDGSGSGISPRAVAGGRRGPLPDGAGSALQYFWEVKAGERWMR